GTATPFPTPTGPRPTITPTRATATPCAGSATYTGSITNTDSIQTNRLALSDPKSSCAAPRPLPATSDTLTRHYRSYTYTNSTSYEHGRLANLYEHACHATGDAHNRLRGYDLQDHHSHRCEDHPGHQRHRQPLRRLRYHRRVALPRERLRHGLHQHQRRLQRP